MKILVLAIFPRGKDATDGLRKLNDATNKILAGYADNQRVFYLDVNSKFLEDGGILPAAIMPDLLHPNEKGYEIWAEAMEPTVKQLMGDSHVSTGVASSLSTVREIAVESQSRPWEWDAHGLSVGVHVRRYTGGHPQPPVPQRRLRRRCGTGGG